MHALVRAGFSRTSPAHFALSAAASDINQAAACIQARFKKQDESDDVGYFSAQGLPRGRQ